MSISVSEMTIPESFFLLKNGYTAVCIASPLAWFGVCTADSLLLQDDEKQRTDSLNCGLHIDLKKQIFLGIIIGNICFFVRKIEER